MWCLVLCRRMHHSQGRFPQCIGHGEFRDLPGGNPELFTDAHPQLITNKIKTNKIQLRPTSSNKFVNFLCQKIGPKSIFSIWLWVKSLVMNPKIDGFYSCSSHSNREKNGILTHSHMFLSGFLIMTTLGYPHWTRLRSVLPFGGCSASKGAAAGSFTARGHAVAEPHGVLPEVLREISTLRTC